MRSVFTETVRAANHAINRLDPHLSIDLITGSTGRARRREILDDLRDRKLDAVAAPRVLDEGIDVPDANLGVVMSASRTRRQMIQRMGRILRRKRAGVAARFVIMFAKDTFEDPANRDRPRRLPRRDRAHLRGDRRVRQRATSTTSPRSSPQPGPAEVRSRSTSRATRAAGVVRRRDAVRARSRSPRAGPSTPTTRPSWRGSSASSPHPDATADYLEPELTNLPEVKKPKVEPTRLSTGEVALQIARSASGGASAAPVAARRHRSVQYRWQALDQTVPCRCE